MSVTAATVPARSSYVKPRRSPKLDRAFMPLTVRFQRLDARRVYARVRHNTTRRAYDLVTLAGTKTSVLRMLVNCWRNPSSYVRRYLENTMTQES